MIKVSVIVPVYNVEKYLEKCLHSLVNQTFNEYEVIVVNDESPDNSQEIIDKYVKKYPNIIKTFFQKNGGQGSARNLGIKKAIGKYIMFVDSDDSIENDMIEKMYTNCIKNNYDILMCNNYIDYEITKTKDKNESFYFNKNDKYSYFFSKPAVWNKIIKKSLIIDNSIYFRENVWYEDLDFTVKLYGVAKKVGIIEDYLYNYLYRPGSTMNNSNILRNLEIISAFEEIESFYNHRNEYKKYKEYLEFLAIYNVYIATSVRVINSNNNRIEKNKILCQLRNYLTKKFPNYSNNAYIKKYMGINKVIILRLLNLKMYYLIKMLFRIKKLRSN